MANAKISQLPSVTGAAGADLAVAVASGVTSQITVDNLFKNRTLVAPALGTPASGNLSNCTALPLTSVTGLGANVATFLATPSSANLASAVTDETGSGALVFANTPTLVTPILGTPTSGTLTTCTGLPISTGVSGLGTGVATALGVNVGTTGSAQLFTTGIKADFESQAAAINTTGKFAGKQVWSTTDSKPVWAAGAAAGDVWVDSTGATVYAPV